MYGVVLENFSELSGEHRVARLGISLIYLSLRADFANDAPTCQNQSSTPWLRVSRFARRAPSHHLQAMEACVALLSERCNTGSRRKWKEKDKKRKTLTWLTACVLFCHAGAMQRWAEGGKGERKYRDFMPIYKLGAVG